MKNMVLSKLLDITIQSVAYPLTFQPLREERSAQVLFDRLLAPVLQLG